MAERRSTSRAKLRLAHLAVTSALALAVAIPLAPAAVAASADATLPAVAAGALAPVPVVHHTKSVATIAAIGTSLSVQVPSGSVIGKDVDISTVLRNRYGQPLAGEHLSLLLDGASIRSDKTDPHGAITFTIPGKSLAEARGYALVVQFSGAHGLAPSIAKATLTILAAAIQIQTVPPLANIRFTLGTEAATTGPDGVAALPVPKTGTYALTADLNPDNSPAATVRASFVRWLDNVYTANRNIDVSGPATYVIGLRVAYRASIRYVDLDNNPVDPALIDQASFSAGIGTDDVILSSQTKSNDVWWTAATTVRISTSLTASPVTYRALSVKIHGADVVNRGQQAWTPTENGEWTVQLLLYTMTVQARDAIFGTPVSGQLRLTYPDGASVEQHVASDGRIAFANLPRGQYQLGISPSVFSPPTPVALSRPQEAIIRVITYLDAILVTLALLLVTLLLVVIGRWPVVQPVLRRLSRRMSDRLNRLAREFTS